jgi:AraC-like DNA-binding protein
VGYEEMLTFSKFFKKQIGLSPSDYRKKYTNKSEKTNSSIIHA